VYVSIRRVAYDGRFGDKPRCFNSRFLVHQVPRIQRVCRRLRFATGIHKGRSIERANINIFSRRNNYEKYATARTRTAVTKTNVRYSERNVALTVPPLRASATTLLPPSATRDCVLCSEHASAQMVSLGPRT
jgi:hypothetical protein